MLRLTWLSDVHLDFVSAARFERLLQSIVESEADAVLLGGDLSQAPRIEAVLRHFAGLSLPVYSVLGNHDYYRGSIADVRGRVHRLSQEVERLVWLPAAGVVSLTGRTALIGHGGWGDARAGSFRDSSVVLNDYWLIHELRQAHGIDSRLAGFVPASAVLNATLEAHLKSLGDEAAVHFQRVLPEALEHHEHVYVLMHVPPFREACWHEGRLSDDDWAPHFCSISAGEALVATMRARPDRRMTVLCGHTHSSGRADILPNLEVLTAAAEYGNPQVQEILDVS